MHTPRFPSWLVAVVAALALTTDFPKTGDTLLPNQQTPGAQS